MIWLGVGVLAFLLSLRIRAPYGRHLAAGWGPTIPNRLGWILMETPVLLVFSFFFLSGSFPKSEVHWVFAGLFYLHYVYRALIFPFRLRTGGKRMPLAIAGMAILFNCCNGFFLGYGLGNFPTVQSNAWFYDPRFIAGLCLFGYGLLTNWWADDRLIRLRKPGEQGYRIPRGGLFERVSCPNHFGEMLEWCGYALLTWSAPAAVFAAWTILNVLPRSLAHHRWYRETFSDYPSRRKAVWPGIL